MNDKRDIGTCDKLYFGKYRGTVINNLDPMQMGRVQALVPDVTGNLPSSWAMPCLSVGGMQGGMFTVPIVGSGVWIEFEQGDPDYPIWTGCFYGSAAETPSLAKAVPPGVPAITFQTPLQNGLTISDVPGDAPETIGSGPSAKNGRCTSGASPPPAPSSPISAT